MTSSAPSAIWDLLKGANAASVKPWLGWHPSQIDECVAARGSKFPAPLNAAELEELRNFHVRCHAGEDSLAALQSLGSSHCRVVVTGQQPGILAGPLYSVYKALGAVKLARELSARHPRLTFIPVFWVASEDHDFPEVRRAIWPGSDGEIEEVLIEHPDWRPGRMVGTLECGKLAENLLQRIKASTFETEFRAPLLETIVSAYAPGDSWEEAFCRLLFKIFEGSGLVVVSPLMKWVRRRAVPILQGEARRAGESSRIVIERGEQLQAAGFSSEVHRHPDAVNLFYVDEAQCRHPLRLRNGKIEALVPSEGSPNSAESAPAHSAPFASSPEELASKIAASPESFSFNVVTRPLVQDAILPTVAQLVGPGEAAYFAQVEAVYEKFGVFAPVRYPRPQILLVQKNVARTLEKYGLSIDDALHADAGKLARKIIERDLSEGIVGELRELRSRHAEELAALRSKAGNNTSIASAFEKLHQSMEKGFDTIQDRLLYSQQEDQRHLNDAMLRVEHSLNPSGKPQERVLNPLIPFALTFGPKWLLGLADQISIDPSSPLQVISLAEIKV